MTSSSSNDPPGLQSFTAAARAKPVRAMAEAAKATLASSNDPDGLLRRLERSKAQTPKGFRRLANAITRQAIGIPLTRKQRAEIRAQRPKLDPKEIDKNSYRAPVIRQRSPREMKNRRNPGWTDCNFVLPRVSLEGLRLLAIASAAGERQLVAGEPLGYRRRYPKTKNFFVVRALNQLFEENGMPQFCVQEAEPGLGASVGLLPQRIDTFDQLRSAAAYDNNPLHTNSHRLHAEVHCPPARVLWSCATQITLVLSTF